MSQTPLPAWLSRHRRVLSLGAAGVVSVVMVVWGALELTAPFKPLGGGCGPEDQSVTSTMERGQVEISVYNAGAAPGTAKSFADRFTALGFKVRTVGNAPAGLELSGIEVVGPSSTDDATRLVAAAFGTASSVSGNLNLLIGPGVNVYVGPQHGEFIQDPPKQIKLLEPVVTCA